PVGYLRLLGALALVDRGVARDHLRAALALEHSLRDAAQPLPIVRAFELLPKVVESSDGDGGLVERRELQHVSEHRLVRVLRAPARVRVQDFGVSKLRALVGQKARDHRRAFDRALPEALAHSLRHSLKLTRAHSLAVEMLPHLDHQVSLRPRLPLPTFHRSELTTATRGASRR